MAREILNPRRAAVYGTMYGMHRTTSYLPEAMKAEIIRGAIEQLLERPRPRGALFASGNPWDAERVDELLAETGFGEWQS